MTIDKYTNTIRVYDNKKAVLRLLAILCLAPILMAQSQTRKNQAFPKKPTSLGDPQLLHSARKQTNGAKQENRTLRTALPPISVTFQGGLLALHSQGGDLVDILQQVSTLTGMLINGSVQSNHVYGDYGPANPLNVLTDLLSGSGYNFMMVGMTNGGAPRELLLTQKGAEPLQSAVAQVQQPKREVDNVPEDPGEQLGPGAVPNVPPPPSEDPQVRMQQNLQKLMQMHEHQMQPNQMQ